MIATKTTSAKYWRLVVAADWDAGFQLTPEARPLDDVPPGAEYVAECTPQRSVVIHEVVVHGFQLVQISIGEKTTETKLVSAGKDFRYRLKSPLSVQAGEIVHLRLRNNADQPRKPKTAALVSDPAAVDISISNVDGSDVPVHENRATPDQKVRDRSVVCRACGRRDGTHDGDCRAVRRAAQEQLQAECDHRPEYGTTRTTGDPLGPPCCGRCDFELIIPPDHGDRVKTYRRKHAVEAMRWTDTDKNREAFAAWFEQHDAVFETRGPVVSLPDFDGTVSEGEWILYSDGEFIVMEDDLFTGDYEETP